MTNLDMIEWQKEMRMLQTNNVVIHFHLKYRQWEITQRMDAGKEEEDE